MIATVSNALVSAILDGLPLSVEDRARLLADAGLKVELVHDVNERTSILTLARMWAQVLERTGDPFVGLRIGQAVPAERFGLAVHAATNGETFRDVLLRFAKFAPLINAMIAARLDESAPVARLSMKFHWDVLGLERHAVDITFAGLVTWARTHLASFTPREVRFRHSLGAVMPACRRLFAAPIVLGASSNEVLFDRAELDQPVRGSNLQLGCILTRFADVELGSIPVVTSLPARVTQILVRELQAGNRADLEAVCAALHMTPRHLQKRLQESSTSFSELRDEVRKSLAPRMLVAPTANVEQVGYRLGFAEPTAFIRAFKKWYRVTPGTYRKDALAPVADKAGA